MSKKKKKKTAEDYQHTPLTEQVDVLTTLKEVNAGRDLPKGVVMQFRGKFGHAGRITENRRLYPRAVMKRELENIKEKLEQKAVIGEADHPGPTQAGPSVRSSAFIITGLGMNDDGEIMGEADVVDTAAGRDLAALIRAGAQVGMSSRGKGTSRPNRMTSSHDDWEANQDWDGKDFDEVNEDFSLRAFDSVIGQAVSDAYVGDYNENTEEDDMNLEELKKLLAEDENLRKQVSSLVFESEEGKAKIGEAVDAKATELEKKFEEEVKGMVKEYMASNSFLEDHGIEIKEDEEEGDEEGEKVVMSEAKCANCDTAMPKGAKFCASCGAAVSTKKEQTQDEKDKAIEALKEDKKKQEETISDLTKRIEKMEGDNKQTEKEKEVEAIVAESLEGKQALLCESVREDLEGRDLKPEEVKAFVEERIKKYETFTEATGGDLSKAKGSGKSIPNDDLEEGSEDGKDNKPKTKDVEILESLD